jgi:hypothetical protein
MIWFLKKLLFWDGPMVVLTEDTLFSTFPVPFELDFFFFLRRGSRIDWATFQARTHDSPFRSRSMCDGTTPCNNALRIDWTNDHAHEEIKESDQSASYVSKFIQTEHVATTIYTHVYPHRSPPPQHIYPNACNHPRQQTTRSKS